MNFSFEIFSTLRSPLENFFAGIDEKIMLYEEHIDTTVAHYHRQMELDIDKNNKAYRIEQARAQKALTLLMMTGTANRISAMLRPCMNQV